MTSPDVAPEIVGAGPPALLGSRREARPWWPRRHPDIVGLPRPGDHQIVPPLGAGGSTTPTGRRRGGTSGACLRPASARPGPPDTSWQVSRTGACWRSSVRSPHRLLGMRES